MSKYGKIRARKSPYIDNLHALKDEDNTRNNRIVILFSSLHFESYCIHDSINVFPLLAFVTWIFFHLYDHVRRAWYVSFYLLTRLFIALRVTNKWYLTCEYHYFFEYAVITYYFCDSFWANIFSNVSFEVLFLYTTWSTFVTLS